MLRGTARWDFMTGVDRVDPWKEAIGLMRSNVTIRRPQLDTLRAIAVEAALGGLPDVVKGVLRPWVQEAVKEVSSSLDELVSSQGFAFRDVIYHVPDEGPVPRPPGNGMVEAPPAVFQRAVWVHYDREGMGEALLPGRVLELYSCTGVYGSWWGVLAVGGG